MADTQITLKISPGEFETIKTSLNEAAHLWRLRSQNNDIEDTARRDSRKMSVKSMELLKQLEA